MPTRTTRTKTTTTRRGGAHPAAMIDLQRDQLLTTAQVAVVTGYTEKTIRNLLCLREGPRAIKMGTKAQARVVYRRSDVELWIMNRGRVVNG